MDYLLITMKRTAAVVILIILLLISAGTNTFLFLKGNEGAAKKELALIGQRDSLQRELLRIEDSLNKMVLNLQTENQTLTSKVSELESDKNPKIIMAYQEINRLRRQLLNASTSDNSGSSTSTTTVVEKPSRGGKGNLEELRRQLAEARKRISVLMAQVDSLTQTNGKIVIERDNAVNDKNALAAENVDLKERLVKGSMPQYGALITTAFGVKNEEVGKAKKVDKFKVTFNVLENPMVTAPIDEEVTIRIIDPDGGVLSTNNKTLQDKSTVFSIKQTITFDGALQIVKWGFPGKGSLAGRLKKGKYITELWSRGLMRQKNTFELD